MRRCRAPTAVVHGDPPQRTLRLMVWLAMLAVPVLVALAAWRMTAMPGSSYRGAPTALDEREVGIRDRLRGHVTAMAGEIGERNVWCPDALERAASYIERHMTALGYGVSQQEYTVRGVSCRNLVAERSGSEQPDEVVVVGAHYDTVSGCPGANDNGSGVAALLELAGRFARRPNRKTVRFVAFVNEEPPFCFTRDMGSRRYSRRCRERNEHITAMLSLETIGCYRDERRSQSYPFPFGLLYPDTGDFIGFVGNVSSRALVRRCVGTFRRRTSFPSEGTAAPGYLPGIFWSDHWSFWRERYRAVMVTDTAPFRYPHYHTPLDRPEQLDYDRMARVVAGLESVVEDLAD